VEQIPIPATESRHRFEFRATGAEYFRIWIVNLLLTIITLGIYSPWAKVRKLRYLYGNTLLAGSSFGYHADPLRILRGRLIALAVVVTYFIATRVSPITALAVILLVAIAMPWLVVKSRLFAMRMTSWRGLRFDFQQDYRGAYRALLGWMVLGVLTLGILLPKAMRERYHFVVSRTRYGSTDFDCQARTGKFYKTYVIVALLALGTIVAAGLVFAAAIAISASRGASAAPPGQLSPIVAAAIGLPVYLLFFAILNGYMNARILNEVFGSSSAGPARLHCQLKARRLMWIYLTNILGIVFSLGLLTPWAQVRLMRYRLDVMEVAVTGSLDDFFSSASARSPSAAGEEISDFLDVDFGF